ncbi:hypothetical protein [Vampirovibrio sp.]|uniref:hypothetical protein n=1 Tax=Vampirovibrio sp. TaxID=2717857 RepID=UPI003593AFCA
MASPQPAPQSRYQEEAGTFLSTMGEMAPQIQLDYSVESLQRLDQFISEHFDSNSAKDVGETLLLRIGSYVGEVIIRHLGGHWNEQGQPEVNEVGPIDVIYPLDKAQKRFENGKEDSLAWYYHSIAKQAYEAELTQHPNAQASAGEGILGLFKGFFKK